jgi:hypothetical protein
MEADLFFEKLYTSSYIMLSEKIYKIAITLEISHTKISKAPFTLYRIANECQTDKKCFCPVVVSFCPVVNVFVRLPITKKCTKLGDIQ